ncbi:MAG: prepilin peptidase [Clostridium sp.]|nr:prepilin peptidase [Clostridium sp.]
MGKGGGLLVYIYVLIILTIAAIQDYRCSKVSNVLIYLGYIISFTYQCIMNNRCLLTWLSGIVVPVILLFLLFYLKMLGAADIKLISMIGGFYGWRFSLYVFALAMLYGAVWSVYKLYRYRNFKERLAILIQYLNTLMVLRRRIPYLKADSSRDSYTIPYSVVILFAFITKLLFEVYKVSG